MRFPEEQQRRIDEMNALTPVPYEEKSSEEMAAAAADDVLKFASGKIDERRFPISFSVGYKLHAEANDKFIAKLIELGFEDVPEVPDAMNGSESQSTHNILRFGNTVLVCAVYRYALSNTTDKDDPHYIEPQYKDTLPIDFDGQVYLKNYTPVKDR